MKFKTIFLLVLTLFLIKVSTYADTFVLRPESFFDVGTWIAETTDGAFSGITLKGMTDRKIQNTSSAKAKINVLQSGNHKIYVRTRDFSTFPGTRNFKLKINGVLNDFAFGNLGFDGWGWQLLDNVFFQQGDNIIELIDTSAYFARVDSIIISSTAITNLPTKYDDLLKIADPLYPFDEKLKFPLYAKETGTLSNTITLENSNIKIDFYDVLTSNGKVIQMETTLKETAQKLDNRTDGFAYLLLKADNVKLSTTTDMFPVWLSEFAYNGGTYKTTTNNTYKSAYPTWMIPTSITKNGNTVTLVCDNEVAILKADWTLDENEKEPKVNMTLTPKTDGYYSIGAFNGKSVTREQTDFVLNPFRINNNRFPSEAVMTTEAFSTAALSEVTYKISGNQYTRGLVADPASLTHIWATNNIPKFGLTTIDYDKSVRPAIFFPVLGTSTSNINANSNFNFAYRPVSAKGGWYNGYIHTVNDVFKVKDYRKNYHASLTDSAFNMLDLLKNDWFSGWDVNAKSHYNMEGRNIVTNSDPLAYLQFYLLSGDKELLERRTIPNLAYLLSRSNMHFKYSSYQDGSTSYFVSDGIMGILGSPQSGYGTATFGGAYKMVRNLIPTLRQMAYPTDGKPNLKSTGGAIGNVSKMSEYVWKYRYTGNSADLVAAKTEANTFINQRITTKQTNLPSDDTFINLDYFPYWSGLLDLYEVTNDITYLNAAEEGARQMLTTVFTQPTIPDGNLTRTSDEVWDNGMYRKGSTLFFHGDKRFRLGVFDEYSQNYPENRVADYTAPNWVGSRVGIGIEQTSTFRGSLNSNIIMTTWAPDLLRLAQYTQNNDYEKFARIAQIGRYANYPGYYQNSLDSYNMTAQFPYEGPDFTSIYYHHIPVLLSQVQDFLITQAWDWSDKKINFPSVRQQGYVWFNSRHYGFAQGNFFDIDNMWLWLKRGLIEVDNLQIDWIGARKNGIFAVSLMNEDNSLITTCVTLGKEVDPKGEITTAVLYYPDGRKENVQVQGGKLNVSVPAKGLVGVSFNATNVKEPSFSAVNPNDYSNSGVNQTLIKNDVGNSNYVVGEVLQMDPENYFAHIYLTHYTEKPDHTKDQTTVSRAVLRYSTDGINYQTLETTNFPLEFIVKVSNSKNRFYYNVDIYDGLGTKTLAYGGGGILEPLYKKSYAITPLSLLDMKISKGETQLYYIPYNENVQLKLMFRNVSPNDINKAYGVLASEKDGKLTFIKVLNEFSVKKDGEIEISTDCDIPNGNVNFYVLDNINSVKPLINKIKLQ